MTDYLFLMNKNKTLQLGKLVDALWKIAAKHFSSLV